ETNTTELYLDYMTSGYVNYGENVEYKCLAAPYRLQVFAGVCLGVSLCGLAGNGVAMWFLGFHVKKTPFTVYILNLAVADFSLLLLFVLLIFAFLSLAAICSYFYEFISFYEGFLSFVELLCHVFDLGSLCLLTAVSVERCVSVL
ncbi:MRGRD protein, partial [Columbina picui]|nr:MRGRD protein [Columbina picui]